MNNTKKKVVKKDLASVIIKWLIRSIIVVTIIFLSVSIYTFTYTIFADIPYAEKEEANIAFEISKDETLDSISARLEYQGIVKSALIFKIRAKLYGYTTRIKPGVYKLNPSINGENILKTISSGGENDDSR